MAGLGIGDGERSRATAQERVLSFVLLSLFLGLAVALVGACSSQEPAATGAGGTLGSGDAGTGGFTGAGGEGPHVDCPVPFTCVSSCTAAPFSYLGSVCGANGVQSCSAGMVPLSTCAPDACANGSVNCCDDTTGVEEPPGCGPDGHFMDCAASSHRSDGECIPASLNVTSCDGLPDTSCSVEGQRCHSNVVRCSCEPSKGGLIWSCPPYIP
jgi:hypothetical protein